MESEGEGWESLSPQVIYYWPSRKYAYIILTPLNPTFI